MKSMSRTRRSPAQPPKLRRIEFCIISAQGLKNVRKFGRKMRSYAVAYVWSPYGATAVAATRVDSEGGSNPTWDEKLSLDVAEAILDDGRAQLSIEIWCRRRRALTLASRDKLVGSVRLLLGDAVGTGDDDRRRRGVNRFPVTSYLVFHPRGEPHGILNVCIPPGGRFPDRLDSISFKEEGTFRRELGDGAVAAVHSDAEDEAAFDTEEDTTTTEDSSGAVHSVRSISE